jgi:hypothetical protein
MALMLPDCSMFVQSAKEWKGVQSGLAVLSISCILRCYTYSLLHILLCLALGGVPAARSSRVLYFHVTLCHVNSVWDFNSTMCVCVPRRIAPHVVFTLVFMDALPKFQKKIGL